MPEGQSSLQQRGLGDDLHCEVGASLLNQEDLPESAGANQSDYAVSVVRLILVALASCACVETLSISRPLFIGVRLSDATTGLIAAPDRASFYVFAFG